MKTKTGNKTIPMLAPVVRHTCHKLYRIANATWLIPEHLANHAFDAAVLSLRYTPDGGTVVWTEEQERAFNAALANDQSRRLS